MKDLLPIGSVVLLKDATKKLVIIGVLQVNAEQNKMYDYLAVPYPEGYLGSDTILGFMRGAFMVCCFGDYKTRHGVFFWEAVILLSGKKKLKMTKKKASLRAIMFV